MKGEWCYFHNVFTPEQCDFIVKTGLLIPSKKATLGVDGELTDTQYRNSEVRFIQSTNPTFQFVFDKLWKCAIQANRDWFQFNINKLDYIQLSEYNPNGFYSKHHDVFWMNGDPIYHRKITCVVQLTDDTTYKGGDFEMFNIQQHPDPLQIRKQGSVIFFPSFIEHQAGVVTEGTRYSLAAWFEGPKFV